MNLFTRRRSGPIEWPDLLAMLQKGNFAATVEALRDLDETQRAELGHKLVALRGDAGTWFNPQQATAYAVAAVGCASTAAKAVTVIARRGWPWSAIQPQPVLRAAADRGVPWLGDLATRLAGKLPRDGGSLRSWRLVADLVVATGVPVPTGERFVDGWLLSLQISERNSVVADRLRSSPFTDALLPHAFERDQIAFTVGHHDPDTGKWVTWPGILFAAAALVDEGRFPRADILDRCLDALLAVRPKAVLHAFVSFHDKLAPTEAEVAERTTIYLKLLTDAMGSVATMAQKVLKTAEAAGGVELESLLDASRTVLTRSEKGLVKAQLIWLEKLAKRHPTRVAEIAEVVAVAADHPDVQARDRSAAFLAKHAAPGATGVQVVPPEPDLLTAPVGAADMPEPIATPDELAEEIAALDQTDWQTVPFERVLAAVVRMHAADPVGLRAAIAPVMQRAHNRIGDGWWGSEGHRRTVAMFTAVLNKAAGLPFVLDDAARALKGTPADLRLGNSYAKLQGVLTIRLAEIVMRLSTDPVPSLVATPTLVNGLLDPAALVERLARAEREGWQPWKRDLRQALYRLPADADPDTLRQARTLTSDAGRTLVEWLETGGAGRPDVRVVRVHRQRAERGRYLEWLPESRFYATSSPDRSGLDPYWLTELAAPPVVNADSSDGLGLAALWPAVLPSQREIVAACLLPLVAGAADLDSGRGNVQLLPLLADLAGPVGPATLTAVAYGLAATQPDERIAALDALMALGGAADFDGGELGAQLARMAGTKLIVLSRVVTQLEEAGRIAPALTWRIASGALGGLLPAETSRPAPGPAITPPASAAPLTRAAARAAARDLAAAFGSAAAPGSAAASTSAATSGPAAASGSAETSGSAAATTSAATSGSAGASGSAGVTAASGAAVRGGGAGADGKAHVTPRGLPDLLTLASTTAAASGSRGEVPGLADLAARKGSTRLVVEAKRLHRTLTTT
ncbi:DUF6493 family protein [Dactylosporangium sp. CA-152071]|uniref:DUF6493 family protein n=1 Tax=Dactylosporangium sp. CA-152071 TaxID=3239933 RepID=UPI003D916FF6